MILFWRSLRRQRVQRLSSSTHPAADQTWPSAESPFYQILNSLAATAGERPAGETLEVWLRRIGVWERPEMLEMVRQHQRWRFNPIGLTVQQQQGLSDAVTAWLAKLDQQGSRHGK